MADRHPPFRFRFIQIVISVEGNQRRDQEDREEEEGGKRIQSKSEREGMQPCAGKMRSCLVLPDSIQAIEAGQAAGGQGGDVQDFAQAKPAVRQQRQNAPEQDKRYGG